MKSYTDLEQSKKLAEILPLDSADMRYTPFGDFHPWVWNKEVKLLEKGSVPCWSLAALLSVIPQEIFDSEYVINITEGCDEKWVITYDHINNKYGLSTGADNLVDACYELILKLNERKML